MINLEQLSSYRDMSTYTNAESSKKNENLRYYTVLIQYFKDFDLYNFSYKENLGKPQKNDDFGEYSKFIGYFLDRELNKSYSNGWYRVGYTSRGIYNPGNVSLWSDKWSQNANELRFEFKFCPNDSSATPAVIKAKLSDIFIKLAGYNCRMVNLKPTNVIPKQKRNKHKPAEFSALSDTTKVVIDKGDIIVYAKKVCQSAVVHMGVVDSWTKATLKLEDGTKIAPDKVIVVRSMTDKLLGIDKLNTKMEKYLSEGYF